MLFCLYNRLLDRSMNGKFTVICKINRASLSCQRFLKASMKIEQKIGACHPIVLIISQDHQIQWNTIDYD